MASITNRAKDGQAAGKDEGPEPLEISPYTVAMAKCLQHSHGGVESLTSNDRHHLINMVQGRMLEYLAQQVCRANRVEEPHLKNKVIHGLLAIFSEEFFSLFRSKITQNPELLIQIARRILRTEFSSSASLQKRRDQAERLFPAIFRKYFEYRNLDLLMRMVESDQVIRKAILISSLKRELTNPASFQRLYAILEEDKEGLCTDLFMDYLGHRKLEVLLEHVSSGQWRDELAAIRNKLDILKGE